MRDFIWRCYREILPCKENLLQRHSIEESSCEVCGRPETQLHALAEFPKALLVWKLAPVVSGLDKRGTSFMDWMERVINSFLKEQLEDWVTICYRIWLARNLRIFQQGEKEPIDTIEYQMQDLASVRNWRESQASGGSCKLDTRWKKPPLGFVKINCDAAVTDESCGMGVIARDDAGKVLFVGARKVQIGSTPLIAEAEAVAWALEFAGYCVVF